MSTLAALTLTVCSLCNRTMDTPNSDTNPDVTIYLQYFDMLSKYGQFPTDNLGDARMVCVSAVVVTLCRAVNVEGTRAWLVLRNHLQGDVGHSFFGAILDLLESPSEILRGLCGASISSPSQDIANSGPVANAYALPVYCYAEEASVLAGADGIST